MKSVATTHFTNSEIYICTFNSPMENDSVSDNDCIKAAEAVEMLDRELDELQKVLDDWTQSKSSDPETKPSDFDALAAWLEGFKPEPEPSNWPKTPANFNNLMDKPLKPISQSQPDWLDETTMTASDLDALRPSFVSWPSTTTAPAASTSASSSFTILNSSSSSGFTTPERPPPEHTTCAPKKKTRSAGAKCRRYSRWSLSRLQSEFIRRFQPLSQKRFHDVGLMARALHNDDMEQACKTSAASTSFSMISQPTTKKQRTSK